MDFTFRIYNLLIQSLRSQGFSFIPLNEYVYSISQFQKTELSSEEIKNKKTIILRHDVEEKYQNALHFAEIQHKANIKGSYYFRILGGKFKRDLISKIAALGHEIGYHYDDLSFCKGDHKSAIQRFEKHLKLLREIAPVQTITMEGAPLSKYDNKDLWKHYNYRDYGIIAEPYFDFPFGTEFSTTKDKKLGSWQVAARPDEHPFGRVGKYQEHETPNTKHRTRNPEPGTRHFDKLSVQPSQTRNTKPETRNMEHEPGTSTGSVTGSQQQATSNKQPANFFYLTDTGRRWDGWRVSVRDKVPQQEEWIRQGLVFRTTQDIINADNQGRLPDKIMMTFHPQRWNDRFVPWLSEFVSQKFKNQVKRLLVKRSEMGQGTRDEGRENGNSQN